MLRVVFTVFIYCLRCLCFEVVIMDEEDIRYRFRRGEITEQEMNDFLAGEYDI